MAGAVFASEADQRAWQLALRPKVCHLALHEKLRTIVASKLTEDDPQSPWQRGSKRKHERPLAAMPAKECRPVHLLAIGAGRNRSASQYPAATNLGISNSSR
jgi:hypothetical protein